MNIDKYQELTGTTVAESDQATTLAHIRRSRTILENMLGYSLLKSKASVNQYEEKGKASTDCIYNGIISDYDDVVLTDPDTLNASYRLFRFNKTDEFLSVDPFTKLYTVKLVFVKAGEEPNGVTHKTFTSGQVRVHRTGDVTKYIERCKECFCTCECWNCLQLAVEADWLNEECLPDDLLYIWSDMVTYYTDCKRDIKSETLGPHSYTKNTILKPEELPESIKIIKKYAGPFGSVNQTAFA